MSRKCQKSRGKEGEEEERLHHASDFCMLPASPARPGRLGWNIRVGKPRSSLASRPVGQETRSGIFQKHNRIIASCTCHGCAPRGAVWSASLSGSPKTRRREEGCVRQSVLATLRPLSSLRRKQEKEKRERQLRDFVPPHYFFERFAFDGRIRWRHNRFFARSICRTVLPAIGRSHPGVFRMVQACLRSPHSLLVRRCAPHPAFLRAAPCSKLHGSLRSGLLLATGDSQSSSGMGLNRNRAG